MQRGFTLIELMVAVAVIGILTAIAYPSYQAHVIKSRRSAAQASLMEIAQRQQQYLLDARSYAPDLSTLGVTIPANVSSFYTLATAATAGPPATFTATATPIAGTAQASDTALGINQAGVKTPATVW
jgi:type IV pilus assembly protein PilE